MKFFYPVAVALLLSFPAFLSGQAEATNWHFGQMRALTFADARLIASVPTSMNGFEGVVTMSDSTGKLLFYTNGGGYPGGTGADGRRLTTGIIWNRNHEVMYDMRGVEGGGWSARQSCLAMPDPAGEAGVYYLFTMEESSFNDGGEVTAQPLGRGLSYFIIDMKLNGGLGGVRLADQRVVTPAYEGLDATPMADGNGYWIICHTDSGDGGDFIVTPLTEAGIGTPAITPAPRPVRGRVKFSPGGTLLYNNGFVFAFDPSTGTIGREIAEVGSVIKNTVAFTPDSRYLYALEDDLTLGLLVTRYSTVEGYEREPIERLSGNDLTGISLANGPLQIGPDYKLYFLEYQDPGPRGTPVFGVSEIDCASTPSPTVNRFVLTFPGVGQATDVRYYLPAYVDAIFARPFAPDTLVLDPEEMIVCAGSSVQLIAQTDGMAYRWSTGDNTVNLNVLESGNYCVTVSGGCQPTVECTQVSFDALAVEIDTELLENICEGNSTRLTAVTAGRVDSILWSNGERGPSVTIPPVDAPRRFGVTVFGPCGTVAVELILEPDTSIYDPELLVFPAAEEVCAGDMLTLSIADRGEPSTTSVIWFDGSTSPTLTVVAEEDVNYLAEVTSECGETVSLAAELQFTDECNCEAAVPELITPNGDNVNDAFRLFSNCTVTDFTMVVFNRWGREVFSADRATAFWDGTRNGTPQEQSIYLYRIVYRYSGDEAVQTKEGQFSLVR